MNARRLRCALQVKINRVNSSSPLCQDLCKLRQNYSYGYVEMELTFTMDLYPFYPPLVKLVSFSSGALKKRWRCWPRFGEDGGDGDGGARKKTSRRTLDCFRLARWTMDRRAGPFDCC